MQEFGIPNIRSGQEVDVPDDYGSFLEVLQDMLWFSRLGDASPWDAGCRRLASWDDWPGPDDPGCLAMALQGQAFREEIVSPAGLDETFDALVAVVVQRTKDVVPYDDEEDAWHGPSNACWLAGWTAALVWCFVNKRGDVPPDLAEQWLWYVAGHWPAGYDGDPAVGPRGLLVF